MAKGSGLSFDPDRIGLFLEKPSIVINSFHHQEDNTLQNYHHQLYGYPHRKLKFEPVFLSSSSSAVAPASVEMDSSVKKNRPLPPTIQFPVNLNCTHDNQDAHIPTSDREKKRVIDEMDFFAHKKDVDFKASPGDTDADRKDQTVSTELDFNVNTGLHLLTGNTSSDQSIVDDGISPQPDAKRAKNEISVLRAELERMNAENRRLKETLDQVTNNYSALQMHLMTMMQPPQQQQKQEDHQKTESCAKLEHGTGKQEDKKRHHQNGLMVPRQFMDLGLASGTAETYEASLSSSEGHSGHDRSQSPGANVEGSTGGSGSGYGRDDSPEKGSPWGPNKVPRLNHTVKNVDQATEATMRKARVSVRARSEAPMITDGCQWRKYGQKMAKGNPCPRAYYRCTMAAGCPVRKQVQRCAEDRTILTTTYEGNHNHPLPPAAMAMASTTSSAARMLLSGSMPSADGLMNSNFLAKTLLPCSSSMATISASAPFPTVTLDLTQNPNTLQQFQRTPNQFQVPFPNSSQNLLSNPATLLPQIFGQALYNQSKFSGLQMSHDHSEAAGNQLGSQMATPPSLHQGQQNPLADTVSALTADPNFTAALAAAITSFIGNSHQNSNTHNVTTTTTTTTNSNNNGSVTTSNNNSNGNNKVLNSSFPAN